MSLRHSQMFNVTCCCVAAIRTRFVKPQGENKRQNHSALHKYKCTRAQIKVQTNVNVQALVLNGSHNYRYFRLSAADPNKLLRWRATGIHKHRAKLVNTNKRFSSMNQQHLGSKRSACTLDFACLWPKGCPLLLLYECLHLFVRVGEERRPL